LGKTLEKIAPMFPGFGHHPCDVRPIFDPIDFVVFDGYFEGEVTDITFVEFKTADSRPSQVQNSIRNAVEKKRVKFEIRRINKEMIRMITCGQPAELRRLVD
jgi:predicted Holliday junction resolvase-like endonuclease